MHSLYHLGPTLVSLTREPSTLRRRVSDTGSRVIQQTGLDSEIKGRYVVSYRPRRCLFSCCFCLSHDEGFGIANADLGIANADQIEGESSPFSRCPLWAFVAGARWSGMPLRRCEALSVPRGRTSRLRRRAAGVSLGVPTNIGKC